MNGWMIGCLTNKQMIFLCSRFSSSNQHQNPMNHIITTLSALRLIGGGKYQNVFEFRPRLGSWALLTAAIFSLAGFAPTTQAQTTMTIKPFQIRAEVPSGFSGTVYLTNNSLRIPTNGASGVDGTGTNWIIANVNVGISGAPLGCTATLVDSG